MMKNYDGAMVMPANYAVVTNEEMTYLDGGIIGWGTLISLALSAGTFTYGAGYAVGQRAYYRGLTNAQYQKIKWKFRSTVLVAGGVGGGAIFMLGFENAFYGKIKK